VDYFTQEEKTCHCGCGLNRVDDNPDFLFKLNRARELYGRPMEAESMTRCPAHNAAVGGTPGSAHEDGRAADIKCIGTRDRARMVKALMDAGFTRIELKERDVHADMKVGAPDMLAIKIKGGGIV